MTTTNNKHDKNTSPAEGTQTTSASSQPEGAPEAQATVDEKIKEVHDKVTEKTAQAQDKLAEELAQWKDRYARAQAEFENTRRRLEKRQEEAEKHAGARIINNMIGVVDDLEYAQKHAQSSGRPAEAQGINAIYEKMIESFKKEGVTIIDPQDKPFDHNCQTAVKMVDDPALPDQTVVEVLQKGYELNGRILRPAMVVVSTGGPDAC